MTTDKRQFRTGKAWVWFAAAAGVVLAIGVAIVLLVGTDVQVWQGLGQLESPDPAVRRAAVQAVGARHRQALVLRTLAERRLVQALADPDPDVRRLAAVELSVRRDVAQPHFSELFALLRDPDVQVQATATRVLIDLGPHSPLAPPAEVERLLRSTERTEQLQGLVEVVRHARHGRQFLLTLAELSDHPDATIRRLSLNVLFVLDTHDELDQQAARIVLDKYHQMPREDERFRELDARINLSAGLGAARPPAP
jgi:hypothetical protein